MDDEIDKLLDDLKVEYTQPKPIAKPKPTVKPIQSPSNLFSIHPIISSMDKSTSKADGLIDNLLSQVQADFIAKDAEEELRQQEEIAKEKKRQDEIKAQELAKLEKQAQKWLNNLDPLSSEGLWFEGFARSYPSKLAAAIDYLKDDNE